VDVSAKRPSHRRELRSAGVQFAKKVFANTFTAVSKIDGVNVSIFLGDLAFGRAYIDATAAVTNVSTDVISIIDVSNAERRSLKRESMLRALETDLPILVKKETVIILEDAGLSSSDGNVVFEAVKKAFSEAVASGKFGRKLDAAALLHGLLDTSAMDSDVSFVPTFGEQTITEERTVRPTTAPTVMTAKDNGNDDDSTTVLVIIVVVVVAGVLLVVGIWYLLFYRHDADIVIVAVEKSINYAGIDDLYYKL
jgi:hypothetical protein